MYKHPSTRTARYEKKYADGDTPRRGVRNGFDARGGVSCKGCFEKKLEIDRLRAENSLLKQKLNSQAKRDKEGFFGKATPSSKVPVKANASEDNHKKRGGAVRGHKGHGRTSATAECADKIVDLPMPERCSGCDLKLILKDTTQRTIVDVESSRATRLLYRLKRGLCPGCGKTRTAKAPAMKAGLYSHRLVAQAAVLHYVKGLPLKKVVDILGKNVSSGGLLQAFHRLGRLAESAQETLVTDFRKSPVRHADETGWRTDGHSGYAWLFASSDTSIFQFRDTRSGRVAQAVFGQKPLSGVLVVDRYHAYNKVACDIQYCYAHLLRDVEKIEEEFADDGEVSRFTSSLAPLLSEAMRLRRQPIDDEAYYKRARAIEKAIKDLALESARHEAVRHLQRIFKDKQPRLFHWVKDRNIPAENNFAERELRPTVIARKVSFGSQSEKGAKTRGNLMSLLHTARKRLQGQRLEIWLEGELSALADLPASEQKLIVPPSTPPH